MKGGGNMNKWTNWQLWNDNLVFKTNGQRTIVKDTVTGEQASAKCHAEDLPKFDASIGVMIAAARLVKKQSEKKIQQADVLLSFFTKL